MNIFNIFKRNKKTDLDIENEVTEEILKNTEHNTNARVIKYTITDIELPPDIEYICDYTLDTMPDINSIIWCPNKLKNVLTPYKVIRYDFIIDPESDAGSYVYIVVKNAQHDDISTTVDDIY